MILKLSFEYSRYFLIVISFSPNFEGVDISNMYSAYYILLEVFSRMKVGGGCDYEESSAVIVDIVDFLRL